MTDLKADLPTALLRERDRVRDEVVPAYERLGAAGKPALHLVIRPALACADDALIHHDAAQMAFSLAELRGIE